MLFFATEPPVLTNWVEPDENFLHVLRTIRQLQLGTDLSAGTRPESESSKYISK